MLGFTAGNFLAFKVMQHLSKHAGAQLLPIRLSEQDKRKMDGLIPACVKANMYLSLEMQLTIGSHCFASACNGFVYGTSDTGVLSRQGFSVTQEGRNQIASLA